MPFTEQVTTEATLEIYFNPRTLATWPTLQEQYRRVLAADPQMFPLAPERRPGQIGMWAKSQRDRFAYCFALNLPAGAEAHALEIAGLAHNALVDARIPFDHVEAVWHHAERYVIMEGEPAAVQPGGTR